MTIYKTLLARGYFPKELPPSFNTEQFAKYATTRHGRASIDRHKRLEGFSECVLYELALPGHKRRDLRIPHPAAFAYTARLVAKHFRRLLKLAGGSPFSKSRPIYSATSQRAIRPMMTPPHLPKERLAIRAAASFLLIADINQFYPSLYTHAVGWAVDPTLRLKKNWRNGRFLGRKLDKALMDANGKISQGVAIGNDLSFLLAEIVLARVDRTLRSYRTRAYRWFDDYEIAFDTRHEAEACLKKLQRNLARFKLRLNPAKTKIVPLPGAAGESWQRQLLETGRAKFRDPRDMVRHFDTAFALREQHAEAPILLYAMGILFRLTRPGDQTGRIAESCITQALLAEPGAAQKAFALLSFWRLNGYNFNTTLIRETINKMITQHQWRGPSSDIAWALAFALEEKLPLSKKAAQVLSEFEDDCVLLQAAHLHASGLLPSGFSTRHLSKILTAADFDREHWLLLYEAARQKIAPVSPGKIAASPLFADLLSKKVAFYRAKLPPYALVVHPGGAPEWIIQRHLQAISRQIPEEEHPRDQVFWLMLRDAAGLARPFTSLDEALERLLDIEREKSGENAALGAELPGQSVVF